MPKKKLLSIIVPIFNEEETVKKVLASLQALKLSGWDKEIIVVNDGSRDETKRKILEFEAINGLPLKTINHKRNMGKGRAIRSALRIARGEAIFIQDADLEYVPSDLPKLIKCYSGANAVYGSRNLGNKDRGYKLFILGDCMLTSLANLFFGSKLTDIFTGYKLIPTREMRLLSLTSNGFSVEMEITAKLLKKRIEIHEVPIKYFPRTFRQGKKFTVVIGLSESVLSIWQILKAISKK